MKSSPATPNVIIAGVGLTPIGEHWEKSLRELALEAITAARQDAGGLRPQAMYVANALSPLLSNQTHLGALLADFAGLRGIEALTVEAAGASGGIAFRQAYQAICAGFVEVALVVGVEKVTDRVSATVDAAASTAADADYEAIHGITRTAQAALLMRRYLHEYDAPADALAGFSVTAHANGVDNPYAMYRRPLRREDYARAPMLSEPVNMYDASPLADGAAALVLVRAESLPENPPVPRVLVAASSSSTSAIAIHDQKDTLRLASVEESAQHAYRRAGITPDQVDVFELHDTYSIYAALALEASGFAAQGQGWKLAQDGAIARDGRIPISTFGGSKARGEAGGATGAYQLAEVALQLQDRAGKNQVPGARVGLAQCLGGSGGTAATHLLIRESGS